MSMVRPRPIQPKPIKSEKKPRNCLRSVSKKRQKELTIYAIARKEYLEEHPICEWCDTEHDLGGTPFPAPCTKPSTNVHHSGGRIGKRVYDKKLFKACCDEHGGPFPHDNAAEAYAQGFSVERWRKY